MLDYLKNRQEVFTERTALVFLTAFGTSEYILEALRKSAVDYLLKPLDFGALRGVLEKVQGRLAHRDLHERLDELRELMVTRPATEAPPRTEYVSIYGSKRRVKLLPLSEISYFKGDGSTSIVHFFADKNPPVHSMKNLGFYDDLLGGQGGFFRVAKDKLVNLSHVEGFGPGHAIHLKDGKVIHGSRDGTKKLKQVLGEMKGFGG